MEIGGLLNARHAAVADAQLRQQLHQTMQLDGQSYGLSQPQGQLGHHHQSQLHHHSDLSYHSMQQQTHSQSQIYSTNFDARQQNMKQETSMDDDEFGSIKPKNEGVAKNYGCSTCGKTFARRSDLARHEKIHTNEKPHACDYAGCGKAFIQRSALTVHMRVHSGEKPHQCETCKKSFSDSSSLARHRRIHSGKRPYRCPDPNCQKTFTRKTTLTRHQNNHRDGPDQDSRDSTKLSNTSVSSRATTESPGERTMSASPGAELPPLTSMQRSGSDHGYLPQPSLPPHMRNDFSSQFSPRSTPSMSGPSLASFTSNPQSKPSPTSHPNAYGPPQPLEPPANGTASGSASPHMGPLSWGSPNHGTLPSPSALNNFDYPDPGFGGAALYYPGSSIRRPQSTEPEDYGIRPRGSHAQALAQSHHAVSMPMTSDWSTMPVAMHDIKQERFVM